MKVLKITSGTWHNASRDKRELSVLRELGADVAVMGKGEVGDNYKKDNVDGYDVFRFSTRPLGENSLLNPLNRILSLFIWAIKAKKFKADIITGHDLVPLLIGWLSNIGRKNKAKLVYDCHEFELMSLKHLSKSKAHYLFIEKLERFLINRSAFSIMVNDSIADEVQRIHKLQKRPIVVRNTPSYWKLNEHEIKETRKLLCEKLNVSDDVFLVMYHGTIVPTRGVEEVLEAVSNTKGTAAVILGSGDENYLQSLKKYTASLSIENRTLFLNAVPINELYKFIGASNCGMMTVRGMYLGRKVSYYYGLGNKFFENIQSLTPVICSDLPEFKRLITQYNIGLTVDPTSTEDISASIDLLKNDKTFYAELKNNLKKAKEDLCWENEKHVLKDAYKQIM